MITEGICDVAIELINKNSDGKFHKEAYIKGKVISYGVSILTMGISAAMQCPKILIQQKKHVGGYRKLYVNVLFYRQHANF